MEAACSPFCLGGAALVPLARGICIRCLEQAGFLLGGLLRFKTPYSLWVLHSRTLFTQKPASQMGSPPPRSLQRDNLPIAL